MVSGCDLPVMEIEQGWKLDSRDFFRTRAKMPLNENFLLAGTRCRLSTNSEAILACARKLFTILPPHGDNTVLDFRFWADPASTPSSHPWPKPYFRGLGRFVFAGFDGLNSLLVDLNQRQVVGRFTRTFAEDQAMWKKIVFPVIAAVLGNSIPVSILHCACVELEGMGLLLAGPSGSGKSTLALALVRQGFGYLADDRTYFSSRHGRLFAWSVGGLLKLRSDADQHFPESGIKKEVSLGFTGEKIFELDPEDDLGFKRVKCCEPRCLVFLERGTDAAPEVTQVAPADAIARLEQDLTSEINDAEFQRQVIHGLAKMPCYSLCNKGSPSAIAKTLTELMRDCWRITRSPNPPRHPPATPVKASNSDPLRRLTPLNYTLPINVMGRLGSLETNSKAVLESARALYPQSGKSNNSAPGFTWRIVSEMDGPKMSPWPSLAAFSSGDLRFVNIGQRSFVAIHLGAAEAIGFIPGRLVEDEPGFSGVFLATLFQITTPVLGLTPFMAGCLSKEGRGLLILGPPGSGKTSCAYAASKLGLEFHSGMSTFLELNEGKLCAWAECWPTLFREDTARFYPELKYLGRRLEHRSGSLLSLDRAILGARSPQCVTPVLAVVLKRGTTESPRMTQLSMHEYFDLLQASLAFEEQSTVKNRQEQVLSKLGKIPAYRLTYGNDPAQAAMFCRNLLTAQDLLKAVP